MMSLCLRVFDFDGEVLVRAMRATFERRKTPLPKALPVALTSTFVDDAMKQTQWAGFVRKSGAEDAGSLREAVIAIVNLLEKPLAAAGIESPFACQWCGAGPWA